MADELDELEELGDDAIIAQQQGAHAPKPRARVTEEARSVVISDHPPTGSQPPSPAPAGERGRSGRSEKTVVIRDRRQVEELRRELAKRGPKPAPPTFPGLWLWVGVGVAAFVTGGLVALFATRQNADPAAPATSAAPVTPSKPAAPAVDGEPPSVSIDELPIEGSKK